ncbi:MAG: acyl transferase domain-containing protein [Myxococcota bacterium]
MTERSPIQRALLTIRQLKARVAELEVDRAGPIAVVGLGVRMPGGANDPDALWRLLCGTEDAFVEVPPDRWDADAFPELPRWGAFLDAPVDGFDREFWGISPREAAEVDPQQRLLLELAWEALEDAQLPADALRGSSTGVYVGCTGSDWAGLRQGYADLSEYSGTGTTGSLLANRISYHLDLRGPSLTLDAACSSSLVSVHAAVRDLRAGVVDTALAGGVTLMLDPGPALIFARTGVLSPHGRCRPFDAAADGFARGEGAALLTLMRLDDAIAQGRPIRAVIHGSAVGQDGHGPGLTVPSTAGQAAVARAALADAGVTAAEVGFVEAHAAGSTLGDPIEVAALTQVYRRDGPGGWLGSVKGHIGHLEGACGVASLVKAVLAVQHGQVPPQAGFERLSPTVELDGTGLAVPTVPTPWPDAPLAAVHSYGYGGTNAHAIVGPPPASEAVTAPQRLALTVSARSDAAARALADALADQLDAGVDPADLCASWGTGRSVGLRGVQVEATDGPTLSAALRSAEVGPVEPSPHAWETVRRVPLPTMPWQRQRLRSRPIPGAPEPVLATAPSADTWHAGPPEGRAERITARVCTRAAEVLGFDAPVDPTRPLAEHGFDSMMAITLANRLAADGLGVAVHAVMGGPSPLEIASQALPSVRGGGGIDPADIPEVWMPRNLALSHGVAFGVGAVVAAALTALVLSVWVP